MTKNDFFRELAEWLIATVLKTVILFSKYRGFESLTLCIIESFLFQKIYFCLRYNKREPNILLIKLKMSDFLWVKI